MALIHYLKAPANGDLLNPEIWQAEIEYEADPQLKNAFVLKSIKSIGKCEIQNLNNPRWMHAGFLDSHLHVTWLGEMQRRVSGDHYAKAHEFVDALSEYLSSNLEEEIAVAYAYDEERWGITIQDLEQLLSKKLNMKKAWIVYRVCGHSAFVSPELLKKLGMKPNESMWIDDRTLHEVQQKMPAPKIDNLEKDFLRAQTLLLEQGITAVCDMSLDSKLFQSVCNLKNNNELILDYQGVYLDGLIEGLDQGSPVLNDQNMKPYFEVRHWKRYLDGSFGSRTAWLREPYADSSQEKGLQLYEDIELIASAQKALERGFALSFHAIGDGSLEQILRLTEELEGLLLQVNKQAGRIVHRIEHVQLASDEQIKRLQASNLWMLCLQPSHRVPDTQFIGKRLGENRFFKEAYRLKSFLDRGLLCTLGSDAPIVDVSPMESFVASQQHPNSQENISQHQALWLCTEGARRAHGFPVHNWHEGQRVWFVGNHTTLHTM